MISVNTRYPVNVDDTDSIGQDFIRLLLYYKAATKF